MFGFLFILLSIVSCKDDEILKGGDHVENEYKEISKEENDNNIFSIEEAEKIATAFFDKAERSELRSGEKRTSLSECTQ